MIPVPPILLGALIDAVVTAVTKVIDKRMGKDTRVRHRCGRCAPSVR